MEEGKRSNYGKQRKYQKQRKHGKHRERLTEKLERWRREEVLAGREVVLGIEEKVRRETRRKGDMESGEKIEKEKEGRTEGGRMRRRGKEMKLKGKHGRRVTGKEEKQLKENIEVKEEKD